MKPTPRPPSSASQPGLDLTHSCCTREHTGHSSDTPESFQACEVWTGHREHPSTFLPLSQSCARRVFRSEEDPFVPTFMRYVAFFKHKTVKTFRKGPFCVYVCSQFSCSSSCWSCRLNRFLMQHDVSLCRSKPS